MLQIISGKFFRGEDRYKTDQKGILYSNFSWVSPIVTCVGTLEPVDYFTAVSGFVFSYTNQMEKLGDPKPGTLIRTGEREIVSQFALLAGFALNAYFGADRANVMFNCRSRAISSHEKYVPSQFVDEIFSERHGTVDDRERLIAFVAKAIAMPREQYVALVDVLEALQRAYQAINDDLDLAYSMVVYCLESLAQRFDKYVPKWSDYDERARSKIDKVLGEMDSDAAERVRRVLADGAHLKARARFIHLARAYLSDDFFTTKAGARKRPLRPSELERALTNAYDLRSGYVHELRSIQEQLHQATIADGDVFEWEREPYLTFRGLVNLTREVIRNFVERAPVLEKEQVDWRSDLPGTVRLQMAPQYWVWQHEHIEALSKSDRIADVKMRYFGLLQLVVDVATMVDSKLVDMRKVAALYERLMDRCGKVERPALLATYALFNALMPPVDRSPKWDKLVPLLERELAARTIESMSLDVSLGDELDGELGECVEAYEAFANTRFSRMTLQLPRLVELKILAGIANKAATERNLEIQERFLDLGIGEAAGHVQIQAALLAARAARMPVDLKAIFSLEKKREPRQQQAPDGGAASTETASPAATGDKAD